MPHIFSDNMVLQRNQKVKIWGWVDKGESVSVKFNGQTKNAKANKDGYWILELDPMQAGGPYTMEVTGKNNKMEYTNIFIGEVWICSGQSNMEWQVKNVQNANNEMKTASYSEIRSFNVKQNISFTPLNDLEGNWEVCSPETIGDFRQ